VMETNSEASWRGADLQISGPHPRRADLAVQLPGQA
jgi:hypothetical protein